jgi:hypothetical protein
MSSDDYQTDQWIMDLIGWAYDPCPFNPHATHFEVDGLTTDWVHESFEMNGRVFVNPPYSNPKPWVEKAIYEHQVGGCVVIMLLKHDSSTQWFKLLHEAGAHFVMIQGRLKHQTNKCAPFPSVLAVLS